MKYKISKGDSQDKRHRLLAAGRESTKDNGLTLSRKFSKRTIAIIKSSDFFILQFPEKEFHARDNVFILNDIYANQEQDHIYYTNDKNLIGFKEYNEFADPEDPNNFDLVGYCRKYDPDGLAH